MTAVVVTAALAAGALSLRDDGQQQALDSPAGLSRSAPPSGEPEATEGPEPERTQAEGDGGEPTREEGREEEPAPQEPTGEAGGDEAPEASPSPRPSQEQPREPEPSQVPVPDAGPGTFRIAPAAGEAVGGPTILRYQVQVEDGIAIEPAEAAAEVHAVLGHERGWTNDGLHGFELVADGRVDFMVKIATPATVDDICGQYGLDTGGEVNCRVGDTVMVNLKRWVEGSPQFPGPIGEYRALIINHEVGHRLGHGHEGCSAPGALAPAMMQQIKGLDGCVANAWPYDENGAYISGPYVP